MDNTDLISVILPTYNRAHLIKRSVESILNQTYENIELIIIDDGSTDNTKEVIESLNDKRIVYIYQKNQGCCAARNKGIEVAFMLVPSTETRDKEELEKSSQNKINV